MLTERGVTFDAGSEEMPRGPAASLADPHGNVLVLQTPTAGS